jgi:hypothetical protein
VGFLLDWQVFQVKTSNQLRRSLHTAYKKSAYGAHQPPASRRGEEEKILVSYMDAAKDKINNFHSHPSRLLGAEQQQQRGILNSRYSTRDRQGTGARQLSRCKRKQGRRELLVVS